MSNTSNQLQKEIEQRQSASDKQTGQPVERKPLTKKDLTSDHPTWCPGCGDFSVLATFMRVLEKRQYHQENIVTVSGIGCSSRFPYFIQTHGVHFIHGRSIPFATGVSLSRPDLHVFVFSGDGDAFSIGGNHFIHAARKNIRMTVVVMDNWVYGLTKKQTSPTSPQGYRSKTDTWGAIDKPLNPMKLAIAAGATFIARTSHANPNHMIQMFEAALDHDGFGFIECLSECVEFFPGAFDASNPRKGGVFNLVPQNHNVEDELAAYKLADQPFPGYFGIFYKTKRPSKNELESQVIAKAKENCKGLKDWQILQRTFEKMK
ncbi:MAG: thiamine pyrophosphate-dependent enzyme [Verrucomicrobiia bacterium]